MDDYRQYFKVARRNVSDKARSYLAGLVTKAPRKKSYKWIEMRSLGRPVYLRGTPISSLRTKLGLF